MAAPNSGSLREGIDAGLTDVTAAFVVGKGCTPIWDDGVSVDKDTSVTKLIRHAQRDGVRVIISFGGAAGKDLARSCSNLAKLTFAYASVIDRFGVTQIDFDVEGDAIRPRAEKASIARRFAAIRTLQETHPDLRVSVTVPVGQSGLVASGRSFLRVAKHSHTRLDLVNIMTMDYGAAVADMGQTAIRSAQHTLVQLQSIWPRDTYADLGITPMIGDNDSAGETFMLADAAEVATFAADNGVGRLAFWSLNRDQQCAGLVRPARNDSARNDCSGVAQDPLEFTRAFLAG